jgi:hypothetical protein
MKFIKNFFNLFNRNFAVVEPTHYVFFDGDQVPSHELGLIYKKSDSIQYQWVHTATISTKARMHPIQKVTPSAYGKEATDTYISMEIMRVLCQQKTVKEITIVTNDMDFVDVLSYASKIFPDVFFTLMVSRKRAVSPKIQQAKQYLTKNCSILLYKTKK